LRRRILGRRFHNRLSPKADRCASAAAGRFQ
jgi:hypothetical protein